MSRLNGAVRPDVRVVAGGLAGLALLLIGVLLSASPAQAAFTSGKCAGADISGRGASFARDAHNAWILNFRNNFCAGTPGAGVLNVTYEALGSGAGRTSVKDRTLAPRFGMTDEPPTPTEIQQMNVGTTGDPSINTNPNDDGNIHVVPAAVGAVAPLVNFPDGCDVNLLPAAAKTPEQNLDADGTPDDVIRVRFTKAQWEGIWAADAGFDQWDAVFPELATDTDCDKDIIRVVRFDESGTSFAFKDFLDTIDGAEGWLTTYGSGSNGTREWPGATFGPRTDCSGTPNGPGGGATQDTDRLTTGCSNGNGALVSKLTTTDGSIGYSDISTARTASPSLAVAPEANDNDTYWTQLPNGSDAFAEPTADPNGFRTDGAKGSNCASTTFSDVPTSTTGNWAPVSGVNSPAGYGICTLTYGLVFEDNADVWGGAVAEEAKARTVKDYWDSVLSSNGQALLFSNDYAQLPPSILAISQAGIGLVSFNKTGVGNPPVDPPVDPPVNPPVNPPSNPPSNEFSIGKKEISSKNGSATIEVTVPGAGVLDMDATAKVKKKTIKVGGATVNATAGNTFDLTVKPSAKAKKELKKKGKLKTQLSFTFTPNGGSANTKTSSVTLKLAD